MAVGLKVSWQECERPHLVQFDVFDPSGEKFLTEPATMVLSAKKSRAGDKPVIANCAMTMAGCIFSKPGDHEFRITVDGRPLGAVHLRIAEESTAK